MRSTGKVFEAAREFGGVTPDEVYDVSRHGHSCTSTDVTWVRLPSGVWVCQGDGDSTYIAMSDAPSLNLNLMCTVLLWVNGASQSSTGVFAHYDSGASDRCWAIIASSAVMRVIISDDGSYNAAQNKLYDSSVTAFDSTFHMIGFTFNSGTLTLFIDGAEDTNPTKTRDAAITSIHNGTADVTQLSLLSSASAASFFTGQIALPRIYNYPLSAGQIHQMFERERSLFNV